MSTVALLLAAGAGERLGMGIFKALVPLGGRPMVERSLRSMLASGVLDAVVLVLPAGVDEGGVLAALPAELSMEAVVPGGGHPAGVGPGRAGGGGRGGRNSALS